MSPCIINNSERTSLSQFQPSHRDPGPSDRFSQRHVSRPTPPGARKQLKKSARIRLTIGAPLPSGFRELCASIRIPLLNDDRKGYVAVDGMSKDLFVTKDEIAASNSETAEDEDGVLCTREVMQFPIPQLGGNYFASGILLRENIKKDPFLNPVLTKDEPPHRII